MFRIVIKKEIPSLNVVRRWQFKRWHWKMRQEKDEFANLILGAIAEKKVHFWKATGFSTVRITSVRKKSLDKDNLYGGAKTLIDVMKKLGMIIDDSAEHADITIDQEIGECQTIIEIRKGLRC